MRTIRLAPDDVEVLAEIFESVRADLGLEEAAARLRARPRDMRERLLAELGSAPLEFPRHRMREVLAASLDEPGAGVEDRRDAQQREVDSVLARLMSLPANLAFDELKKRAEALGEPGAALTAGASTTKSRRPRSRRNLKRRMAVVSGVVGPTSTATDPVLRSEVALKVAMAYLVQDP